MPGWLKDKLESRLPGEISITSDMQMMPPLWKKAKNWRASWKWKSKKVGLNVNIQKTKIMASGPITSWQIDGETMEAVTNFIFLGSKITVTGDCSHEIRRCLLLGRKDMTNLDSILKKNRHIILLTEVHLVKAMFVVFVFVFVLLVTYECESQTIKKAER